ncbi:MAG TPA: family 10 glycosylhydrolase [Candidatus Polarisedimenticolia bacterium]|nr:family 10 glycosylhydrolase [Candidatus Polarisedimenticolia bacterium]
MTFPTEVAPVGQAATVGQFRAFWADAFGEGINDQSQIDALVAATKAAHANAIVAQVVRRGDCFCLKSGLPVNESIAPGFDPLQALINTAHPQGVEVHAWIIANAMWNSTTPPKDPNHIFNLHGPAASGRDNWVMTRSDGVSKLSDDWMLDPGHPDAAAWVANTATSIVRNYDIDGINLDRIRYPDGNLGSLVPSWGYNATSLARFRAETGRSDTPANTDPQWTQWRRDQVTGIVRRIYLESTAVKPRIRVSADVITYGYGPQTTGSWENTRAYAEQLQDWRGWLREGILDTAMLMNYKRDSLASQHQMYDEWNEFAKDNQYRRSVVIGSALYLNDIASSVSQVRRALAPSAAGNIAAGWIGYSYRTPDALTDAGTRSGAVGRAELIKALTQASQYDAGTPIFADSQVVPAMTWKSQPIFGHLRGVAVATNGTLLTDTVLHVVEPVSGTVLRTTTTDGSGWFGFVDLPIGAYRVTTDSARVTGGVLGQTLIVAGVVSSLGAVAPIPTPTPTASPSPSPSPSPTTCQRTDGPGIAAPAKVASGIAGFHASWFGQSGYSSLCPGETATAVVAYYNSGTRGWLLGTMGQVAYLGTWNPEPGQDRASMLGGDGAAGSPNTGWPRYNRVAAQPAEWVGPNQVAWFQFTIVAPSAPGTYRLAIRPLIEGAQWMEDFGVFWIVTVKDPRAS